MRIALVTDRSPILQVLTRIISATPEHQLTWCARNCAEAVNLSGLDPPDLILLDLMMRGTNGAETTRIIMQHHPCLILIVTASIQDHCDSVFEALGAGAVDAVAMPNMLTPESSQDLQVLVKKIALLSLLRGSQPNPFGWKGNEERLGERQKHIVAIGCSSGGPRALATLLAGMPNDYHSPIVVLQHMDAQFMPWFAKWLGEKIRLKVKLVSDGSFLQPGFIYLAASGNHLVMNRETKLYYQVEPRETYYRPSVDVFFHSVAKYWENPVTAILLTGMGQDGARGLLDLRYRGAYTIAQDEITSAVYGMPKAAAGLGAAVEILPIYKISEVLRESAVEKAKNCKVRRLRGEIT